MPNTLRFIYTIVWFVVIVGLHFALGVLPALVTALWCAALYLALTTPVRTVRASAFALLFFAGVLLVSHLTLLFQFVFSSIALPPLWSNDGRYWHTVFLAPISEESAKLITVILLLSVWKLTGGRITFGATDLMLCGLAVGIGLNLFEDMLIGPNKTANPGFISILVPWTELNTARGRPDIVFIGHAASAAFIGLALGWSRYLPKWARYLPVVGVWFWMMWCHALYNGQDEFARDAWVFVTAPLTWVTPWVFILAVLATITFEWIVLHRRLTGVEKKYRQHLWQTLRTGFSPPRIWSALRVHNWIRQLAYARVWLRAHPNDRAQAEKVLRQLVTYLENATAR